METKTHLIVHNNHLAPLDGWRGVLALLVVSYHFSLFLFHETWTPYGYLAVDFFFMMSGFIIARQYEGQIATGQVSFQTFAIRRMARLYPLYLFVVGGMMLANEYIMGPYSPYRIQSFGMGPDLLTGMTLQVLMLGILGTMPQPVGPAWSVSMEWLVNMLFFLLVFRYRRIPNWLLWIIVLFGVNHMAHYSLVTLDAPAQGMAFGRGITGFTIGWLIFRYHLLLPKLPIMTLYAIEILFITFALVVCSHHTQLMQYGVDYLFELVIMPGLILLTFYRHGLLCFFLSLPISRFLGKISYSVYLVHYPLAIMMHVLGLHDKVGGYPNFGYLYIALLFAISTGTWLFVEIPGRWMGRKLDSIRFGELFQAKPFMPIRRCYRAVLTTL